jgi:hypothetical protein
MLFPFDQRKDTNGANGHIVRQENAMNFCVDVLGLRLPVGRGGYIPGLMSGLDR